MANSHSHAKPDVMALAAGIALLMAATATSAYGQTMPPDFEEVSGTYTNTEEGVEITFPDGYSGFEASQTSETTLVVTNPGGLSEGEQEAMPSIGLLITDKEGRDITDPSSLLPGVIDCTEPSIESRTVAGVQGYEIAIECPNMSQMLRIVAAETQDRIVSVMYLASSSEFEADLGKFNSAVDSLKIQSAIDSQAPSDVPAEDNAASRTLEVTVGKEPIEVQVESSSEISDFGLDEETKTLSFAVDGDGEASVVSAGAILEGPYVVTIDGQETSDFEESTNEQGVTTITLPHGAGAHEITVTGTQVIPEFSIVTLGVLAALIGVVAVIGRARLMGRGAQGT
jgi:hypothetical protein